MQVFQNPNLALILQKQQNAKRKLYRLFSFGVMAAYVISRIKFCGRTVSRFRPYSNKVTKSGINYAHQRPATEQINALMKAFEDFMGITEVKQAQEKVFQAEKKFAHSQSDRRVQQNLIQNIQYRLKDVHLELDKVSRGEDRYLKLVTKEHAIIKEETTALAEFSLLEKLERDQFHVLSTAIRESHEKERAYAEKTKYWAVIGSIIGAIFGIIATMVSNHIRLKELEGMVADSGGGQLQNLIIELSSSLKSQYNVMQSFVDDLKSILKSQAAGTTLLFDSQPIGGAELEAKTREILDTVDRQEEKVAKDMKEIKALIAARAKKDTDVQVVYVAPEVQELIEETQEDIEWKIKLHSLATVVLIYGSIALTIPILFNLLFKGS